MLSSAVWYVDNLDNIDGHLYAQIVHKLIMDNIFLGLFGLAIIGGYDQECVTPK